MTSEFPIAVPAAMEYSRTCEMGLTQHTGIPYHSILIWLIRQREGNPGRIYTGGVLLGEECSMFIRILT